MEESEPTLAVINGDPKMGTKNSMIESHYHPDLKGITFELSIKICLNSTALPKKNKMIMSSILRKFKTKNLVYRSSDFQTVSALNSKILSSN